MTWQDDAACAGLPTDLFYPDAGGSSLVRAAKAHCAGCTVRQQCLDAALDRRENWGIWGGLTDQERRDLRRRRV